MEDLSPQTRFITVLLVDADTDFSLQLQKLLQHSGYCHPHCGPSCLMQIAQWEAATAAAAQMHPDVVLISVGANGVRLNAVAHLVAQIPGIPVIALDEHDDETRAVTALEAGAQDYLVKGQFDARSLGRALRHALVRERLESRLRMFEVALDSAANGIVITDVQGCIV